ncbi:integrator complex subunit 6-A-like [Diaphorina citri]|uniref:Integrator complex subunit 6-A-like n=1 Tax=Diaphorina citri TaxID=121845 RepID=A0A1S4EBF6_DIACI|nr:integrator complex subunit 6-A-like [Diaphorina citri]
MNMTIIVFLIDTSASMNQRAYLGGRPKLLDIAKGAVETFVKVRQRSPESRGDRYMLLTFEEPPSNIKAGWKENLTTFMTELKNLQCTGMTLLGAALKHTFDVLNMNRMQSGIDTYGQGRSPFFLEPAVIVVITDGGKLSNATGVQEDFNLPMHSPIPGSEMTREPFRWDQRLFSLVLRLAGTPCPERDMGVVACDNSPIDAMCEVTGGRSYCVTSHRMLLQCIDSLVQKVQSGVVINFEKIGPDPPPINESSKDPDMEEMDWEKEIINYPSGSLGGAKINNVINGMNNRNSGSSTPVGTGGAMNIINSTAWHNCRKLIYVPRSAQKGFPVGFWPIPESFWPDITASSLVSGAKINNVINGMNNRNSGSSTPVGTGGAMNIINSTAWHNCRKLIYVPRSAQKGFPVGFWPIPESFWPDITASSLPPRSAHPNVKFTCTSQDPLVIENLPFDKYELEPSPLTQYILARKQPTICWQVFVANSYKNSDVGHPFGYLKASTNLSTVNLFVMPYNYPALLPLIDDFFKVHRMKVTPEWRGNFQKYIGTMPSYYAAYSSSIHTMPISQMGNYQEYLKRMAAPLREVESTPVRQHMFGNPFKIDKRMMVDEADIDLVGGSPHKGGGKRSPHGDSGGGGGGVSPRLASKRKPGPIPKHVQVKRQRLSCTSSESPPPPSPAPTLTPPPSPSPCPTPTPLSNGLADSGSGDEGEGPLTIVEDPPNTNPTPPSPTDHSPPPSHLINSHDHSLLNNHTNNGEPLRRALIRMGMPAAISQSLIPDSMENSLSYSVLSYLKRMKIQAKDEFDRLCNDVSTKQNTASKNMISAENEGEGPLTIVEDPPITNPTPPSPTDHSPPPSHLINSHDHSLHNNHTNNGEVGETRPPTPDMIPAELKKYNMRVRALIYKEVRKPGKNYKPLLEHLTTLQGSTETLMDLLHDIIKESLRFKRKTLAKILEDILHKLEASNFGPPRLNNGTR